MLKNVLLSDILNELLQRENRVLHFWTMRKRRLDQCQQYVVFERSAKQVRRFQTEQSAETLCLAHTADVNHNIMQNDVQAKHSTVYFQTLLHSLK